MEWERLVKRRDDVCSACGARFRPEAEIVTTLDLGAAGFRRDDFCVGCFGTQSAVPFSFWRHRMPAGAKAGPRRLDLAYLTEFFKRLDGRQDDANARRVAYIVALLLLRRRILEETGRTREGDAEVLLLRLKREDREFRIVDPQLDDKAMVSIEEDLARIFNLGEPGEG